MQISFDFTGAELSRAGQRLAAESAEKKEAGWNEKAYNCLLVYVKSKFNYTFMAEDFREWAKNYYGLTEPPSNRAFGGIIAKAAKNGLIKRIGIKQVTNPKAHQANAGVWVCV